MEPGYELCILSAKTKLGASRAADILDSTALIVRSKYRSDESLEERIIFEERPQELSVFSPRRLAPQANISLMDEWLAFCDTNHGACTDPDLPMPRGFRVLDCETVPSRTGGRGPLQALKVPRPLPRTIEDAVFLTQSLGCRYLWVDRYCIPQDDPIAKHLQLRGMDVIYQHAFFTIIAAAGDNPHHGLPGVRDTPRNTQLQCTVGSRTLISVPLVKREILKSTWSSRGWTYQEGLLSRRRIVFTDSQVYYQCNAMHCLEGIRAPLESLHIRDKSQMSDHVNMSRVFPLHTVGKQWRVLGALISEYLDRSLTFENDVLDAFRGILAVHERRFSVEVRILAGIPISMEHLAESSNFKTKTLVSGLSWFFQQNKGKSYIQKLERRAGFPSWTWLGWKPREAVSIMLRDQMTHQPLAYDARFEYTDLAVLDWSSQHDLIIDRGFEGQIPCFLWIQGPILEVQAGMNGELTDENDLLRYLRSDPDPNRGSWCDITNWTRDNYSPTELFPRTFTLLALCYSRIDIEFLVLYRPPGFGHFCRIDIVNYPRLKGDLIAPMRKMGVLGLWPERKVKIG
ncbi:Heterokaryon incompatibility protein (HET) domain containing protein [Rhypophila decipiens]